MRLLITFILLFPSFLHAFCIYNDSENVTFFLRQNPNNRGAIYSKTFKVDELKPGEKACCPYTTYDCNASGNQEDYVDIYTGARFEGTGVDDFQFSLPAGGWAEFTGKGKFFQIQAYHANGEVADFKLKRQPDRYVFLK